MITNNQSPKVIRAEAQMFPLVESWLQSKLTQKQISEQHCFTLHILLYWEDRYRQKQPGPAETTPTTTPTNVSIRWTTPLAAAKLVLSFGPKTCISPYAYKTFLDKAARCKASPDSARPI